MLVNPLTQQVINSNPEGHNQYTNKALLARGLSGRAAETDSIEHHRDARNAHEEALLDAEELGLDEERKFHREMTARHRKRIVGH